MGRPLSKRFFGLAEAPGGESVSSLTVNGANSYSSGTTITFSASPIGGTTAEASVTFVAPADNAPGNGNVAAPGANPADAAKQQQQMNQQKQQQKTQLQTQIKQTQDQLKALQQQLAAIR